MRTGTAIAALVGVTLLVGPPLWWRVQQPAPSAGVVPSVAVAPTDPGTPTIVAPDPSPTTVAPSPPTIATRDASLGDGNAATAEPRPIRLRIPAIGVDAEIVRVGVDEDGQMGIPTDVATAGWYRFGPAPGDPGSAVLAGHVDSRSQGLGAFHRLRELDVDEPVEVVMDDGVVRTFVTVARETYDKTAIPLADVFSRDGPPRIALITCGGDFDRGSGHYRSNIVVYAVPTDG